jgi:hypothetical protein
MVEHANIFGLDYFGRVHTIAVRPTQRRESDFVILLDIAERPEERVPVPCNRDIPHLTWQCGSRYVPNRPSQSFILDAFQNHHLEAYCAYLESPQGKSFAAPHANSLIIRTFCGSEAGRTTWGGRKFIAFGRHLQRVQLLLESPVLIGLIELRIREHKTNVTERCDANDKTKPTAPAQKRVRSRARKRLSDGCESHGGFFSSPGNA